jgi:hypothetical protein
MKRFSITLKHRTTHKVMMLHNVSMRLQFDPVESLSDYNRFHVEKAVIGQLKQLDMNSAEWETIFVTEDTDIWLDFQL